MVAAAYSRSAPLAAASRTRSRDLSYHTPFTSLLLGLALPVWACGEWTPDAPVSFSFNVGIGAFKDSTLVKRLNAGDYAGTEPAAPLGALRREEGTGPGQPARA